MRLVLVLALVLGLAACGNSAQERMLSGAAIGAIGGGLLGGLTTPTPAPHYHHR